MNETDVTVETAHGVAPATASAAGPRTRWAAILWGVVMGAIAAGGLWLLLSPDGPAAYADWIVGLTPLSIVAYSILAVGGLLLVAGVGGLARRVQRRAGR